MPLPRGVIFDLDGTLTVGQPWAFKFLRSLLNVPSTSPILSYVNALAPGERSDALRTVRCIERLAMKKMVPTPGLRHLLSYLREHSIPTGVLTRNFSEPVRWLEEQWLEGYKFDEVLTREEEEEVRAKPEADGIVEIAKRWGTIGKDVWMIGDMEDDIVAGERAGAKTVYVVGAAGGDPALKDRVDMSIERLDELIPMLESEKMSKLEM